MERDYDYTSSVYYADLADPAEIGEAGERAVKRLNARKVETQQVPVIYAPGSQAASRHFAGGINGLRSRAGHRFSRNHGSECFFG